MPSCRSVSGRGIRGATDRPQRVCGSVLANRRGCMELGPAHPKSCATSARGTRTNLSPDTPSPSWLESQGR
eukprot:3476619-Rhodomonas_salina.4